MPAGDSLEGSSLLIACRCATPNAHTHTGDKNSNKHAYIEPAFQFDAVNGAFHAVSTLTLILPYEAGRSYAMLQRRKLRLQAAERLCPKSLREPGVEQALDLTTKPVL